MNLVIPMAGRGSRFADVGFALPKPLIPIEGRPMYSWATDSLPLSLATRLVFVCLQEHVEQFGLEDDIRTRYADYDPTVIAIDGVTDGQLCTVLLARDHFDESGVVIFNADTIVRSDIASTLTSLGPEVDGVIGVFEAPGDHWSFARLDESGRVVETAEKRRISKWATTGLYHFSSSAAFLDAGDRMIADDDRTRGEFFVAPLYSRMIDEGAEIRVDVADEVWPVGTPAELEAFERHRDLHVPGRSSGERP